MNLRIIYATFLLVLPALYLVGGPNLTTQEAGKSGYDEGFAQGLEIGKKQGFGDGYQNKDKDAMPEDPFDESDFRAPDNQELRESYFKSARAGFVRGFQRGYNEGYQEGADADAYARRFMN